LIAVFCLAAFRSAPALPASLRIAIRFGFATLAGAMVVGALMIAKGMRLVFAGDPQTAYATGGALKPTHAATMHAILILPALAWLLSFVDWTERRRVRVILVATVGYLVFAAAIAAANFSGRPLVSMPLAAVALVGFVVVLATGCSIVLAVARGPRKL